MDQHDRAIYEAIKTEIDKANDLTNDSQVQRDAFERALDLVQDSPWRASFYLPGDLDARFYQAMTGYRWDGVHPVNKK